MLWLQVLLVCNLVVGFRVVGSCVLFFGCLRLSDIFSDFNYLGLHLYKSNSACMDPFQDCTPKFQNLIYMCDVKGTDGLLQVEAQQKTSPLLFLKVFRSRGKTTLFSRAHLCAALADCLHKHSCWHFLPVCWRHLLHGYYTPLALPK